MGVLRQVEQADAFVWLARHELPPGAAVVTSLPDAAALDLEPDAYTGWLRDAALLLFSCLPSAMPIVFFQTDRKHQGRWLSKPAVLQQAAASCALPLLWHKIVLRRAPGQVNIHRPTYSHLLAFGRCRPGAATPDVLPESPALYREGMPVAAARLAAAFCQGQGAQLLVDPFCGWGTVLAAAEELGLSALGVEIEAEKCGRAASSSLASLA